ncbi:hypothetical protein L3Q82_025244, partial [Scortum barcoo]
FCTDAVLPTKTIKVFPNQKPWLDSTVKPLLKACDAAYRSARPRSGTGGPGGPEHAPLLIHGEAVERVNNIKFLGIHITSDLTWSMNTAHLVKKAQQRLFFLRKLKRAGLSPQLLTNFYRATICSFSTSTYSAWLDSSLFFSSSGVAGVRNTKGLFFIFTLLSRVCLTSSIDKFIDRQGPTGLMAEKTTNSELISKYMSFMDPVIALLKKTSEASPDFAPLEGLLENIKGLMEETNKQNEEFGVKTEIAEQELEKLKKLFKFLEEQ